MQLTHRDIQNWNTIHADIAAHHQSPCRTVNYCTESDAHIFFHRVIPYTGDKPKKRKAKDTKERHTEKGKKKKPQRYVQSKEEASLFHIKT
jgi:hypothetical protein